MKKYLLLLLILSSSSLFAQDLLKQLESENKTGKEVVIATFKSTKIINIQTNETNKKKTLDFRISHLFGNIGAESGGGIHDLYGFDQSNDIRVALHYGITDKLMVGISRCKRAENMEGLAKYRVLEQTTDNKMPIAITLFGQATLTTQADVAGLYTEFIHRFNYTGQLIIARKFSPRLSLEVVPSFVHRNVVDISDVNDLYSVGGGLRYKFTSSMSVIADYFYTPPRPDLSVEHFDPIGIGFEIETGGHVFSIMFTNASGILENDYIANTTDSWAKGGFKFSFNISRTFKL